MKILRNTKIFQSRSGQFNKILRNIKIFQLKSDQFSEKMNVLVYSTWKVERNLVKINGPFCYGF